jgi:thiol-disulfide isomerase/thioredoxin
MKTVSRYLCLTWIIITMTSAAALELPPGIMTVDGKPAPVLQLNNLDGDPYDLAATHGHWRFVHFWASWCGPCRREMPSIGKMSVMMGDTRIEFILVNTAETEDEVFTFLGEVAPELDAAPLMDLDGLVTEDWQPRGLPATYLVDPDGYIRYQALGGREWEKPAFMSFLRSLETSPATTPAGSK